MKTQQMGQQITVRLSPQAFHYLKAASYLSRDLRKIILSTNWETRGYKLVIPKDTAELFREEFTTRLATVGFDDHYGATPEGMILDTLIDEFYRAMES